jgi:hypothetical protein
MLEALLSTSKGHSLSTYQKLVLCIIFLVIILFNYFLSPEIASYWPLIGIGISFTLSFRVIWLMITSGQNINITNTKLFLCFFSISYAIHQYEENGFDLMNRGHYFPRYANELISSYFPFFTCHNPNDCAFSPVNVMAYNTAGLWIPIVVSPLIFPVSPMFTLGACGMALVNVLGHCFAVVLSQSYSPGVMSGIVLVVPVAMVVIARLIHHTYNDDFLLWTIILGIGFGVHGVYGSLVLVLEFFPHFPSFLWFPIIFVTFVIIPYCGCKVADLLRLKYLENFAKQSSPPVPIESNRQV